MKSPVIKRSIIVDGHKTSISLEDAFWSSLKEIAQAQKVRRWSRRLQRSTANAPTCPLRSVYLYSTGSAMDKWVNRSRRSERTMDLQHPRQIRAAHAALIIHTARRSSWAAGGDLRQ